ncbi:MAG TPA: AP2 domain-containing protein [Candidatus Angelobacter sp.]|jgi:hypothetical protein
MYKKLRSQPPAPPDEFIRYIPLTQGKFAIVDASDYEWLSQWHWAAEYHTSDNKWRAKRNTTKTIGQKLIQKTIYMHRQIINAPDGVQVDHVDGNPLNDQRGNLRLATHQQNMCNQGPHVNNACGYKGVYREKGCNSWRAEIKFNRRKFRLGSFPSPQEAAKAYEQAARRLHGEFARTEPFKRSA